MFDTSVVSSSSIENCVFLVSLMIAELELTIGNLNKYSGDGVIKLMIFRISIIFSVYYCVTF